MSIGIKKFEYAETLSRVQRNFNLCLSDLLIYDLFFKIVATVIWGAAAAWLFNRLVATSGSLVIGNEQIITFILSPVGLGAFILSGGSALAIVFAEQAGLIFIASRSEAGGRLIFFHAYWWMLKSLGKLMALGVRQVIADRG